MSELRFGSIERSDTSQVLSLFQRCFHRDRSEASYAWQFFDCPFGGGYSRGAWLEDRLVAHIGYTPRLARVNGHNGRVLSNHAVMSDPDHRGKGYYSRLLIWALRGFADEGWDLVLSHPNQQSHPVQMMHRGYVDVGLLPALVWRGGGAAHAPLAVRLDEKFKLCAVFGEEYDRLCEAVTDGARYALARSANYLSWRYGRRPMTAYYLCEHRTADGLQSAAIVKPYPQDRPTRINIVEWLCSDEDREAAEKPIREVLDFADTTGLEVQLWHSVHDRTRRYWLERLGFADGAPIFHFGLYTLQSAERLGPCAEFRHWYTTMGDLEVF